MKGLPWIRLDVDLREHPKADRLADALGERRAWTYVVELWMWVGANQPDGDLSQVPDSAIARRAGYEGDAVRFVAALVACEFLGADRRIVGWVDRQGALAAKFDRDRKKPDGRKAPASRAVAAPTPPAPTTTPATPPQESRAGFQGVPHGDVDVDVDEAQERRTLSVAAAPAGAAPPVPVLTSPPHPDARRRRARPKADAPPSSFDAPCPHPDREGRHETYADGKGGMLCHACGARRRADVVPDEPERSAYLARYRELFSAPAADFTAPGLFAWRRLRTKHGTPALLTALEGCARDDWVRAHWTLKEVCSQAGVERGLKQPVHHASSGAGIEDAWAEGT
jgi:hypothetical protein